MAVGGKCWLQVRDSHTREKLKSRKMCVMETFLTWRMIGNRDIIDSSEVGTKAIYIYIVPKLWENPISGEFFFQNRDSTRNWRTRATDSLFFGDLGKCHQRDWRRVAWSARNYL